MLLLKSLHEDLGLTVVMVLHDLNHVARFSSRIVAVQKGKIVAKSSSSACHMGLKVLK